MFSRREFLQVAAATAAIVPHGWTRAFAQQRLTQDELLRFEPLGNVTLVHVTDIHGQLVPIFFREPSVNLGVGDAQGLVPHITGQALLDHYKIPAGSALAYALSSQDFAALAKSYGRLGGLDRIATIVKAIRAERGDRVLLLDGGDTWQNSYTSLVSKGQDMVDCMALMKPDAMTGHWEFTLGADRGKELVDQIEFPFLAQNVRDTEWNEEVFKPSVTYQRGGVAVAVIGQALPYTPISNPRWMIPDWTFGIREDDLKKQVESVRKAGAHLVVLLSHNGFDLDRKLAARVPGIDVILTGHTHDALPDVVKVGKTLLVASGSHGKFVSRLDLDVRDGEVRDYRFKLIPVFADAIAPEPEMAAKIHTVRAPHEAKLREVLGRTETLLYRRGNVNGTLDDLICDALLAERDAEIALSPGFRWGNTLPAGHDITREDVYNATAITYPAVYRTRMTGAFLKTVLEDVADNLFNPDPYYQQGGDMVRTGGLGYTIDVAKPMGQRISAMTHLKSGKQIDANSEYVVAGWASVNPDTEGPPVWELVERHIARKKTMRVEPNTSVKVVGI